MESNRYKSLSITCPSFGELGKGAKYSITFLYLEYNSTPTARPRIGESKGEKKNNEKKKKMKKKKQAREKEGKK